jgi:chromosome segregation ATPase
MEVRDQTKELNTTLNALKVEVAEQMRERLQGHGTLQAGLDDQKTLIEALNRNLEKQVREITRAESELKDDVDRAREEFNATISTVDMKVVEEEKGRERSATSLEMKTESIGQELRALISAERSSRADQDEKLRNDTIDAVQKEISARQDADQSLVKQLTQRMEKEEADLREQAEVQANQIRTLEATLAEVRSSVETVEQAVLAGAGIGDFEGQSGTVSGSASQASSRRRR